MKKKRKSIAEGAWSIIKKEGIEKASIRRVATEAGMSAGALRHYFSTKDEMLLFIMDYYLEEGKKNVLKVKVGQTIHCRRLRKFY